MSKPANRKSARRPASDFAIDKIAWHLIPNNPESPDQVRNRFKVVVAFLEERGLTTNSLLTKYATSGDEFEISSSDLTPLGYQVIEAAYDRWLRSIVNRRKDLSNLTILESALKALRRAT